MIGTVLLVEVCSHFSQLLLRQELELIFGASGPCELLSVAELSHCIDELYEGLIREQLDCPVHLFLVDLLVTDAMELFAKLTVVAIVLLH